MSKLRGLRMACLDPMTTATVSRTIYTPSSVLGFIIPSPHSTASLYTMSKGLEAGTYRLTNVSTGTVLDLWDGRSDEGTAVQGFTSHGGDNQKWRLKWTGTGSQVTLQNVKGGTYIGAASNIQNSVKAVGSKTPVPLFIVAAGPGEGYAVTVAGTPLYVLDLKESNPANETPVIFYNNNATDNQKWYFEKV
ncbi:unnamed protein product [Rhizoctonia solani]|uniref:Ricin B lectin domain-containing protein n=1 Tax=Rhizoctonia solani TaxID=456999 RepID=A0A8H3BZY8_9AGAM|nr:unnamed protein product [Rhizoctonia solani]